MSELPRKKPRTNLHSKEQQDLIRKLANQWFGIPSYSGVSFRSFWRSYGEQHGIPERTLRNYCYPDISKRVPLSNEGESKQRYNALIPPDEYEEIAHQIRRLGLDHSQSIQQLKRRYGLDYIQAYNQFRRHIKPILEREEVSADREHELEDDSSERLDLDDPEEAMEPQSVLKSSAAFCNQHYLVYHFRHPVRYQNGLDPSCVKLKDQKPGHPLRNNQPKPVKEANRDVTSGAYFISTSVQAEISSKRKIDLVGLHFGLHHVPHGTGLVQDKASSDELLRSSGVVLIDVPEEMDTFSYIRSDDGITLYRSGTPQADRVSMNEGVKIGFLNFLRGESCKDYRSNDSGRDIGGVYRYDLLFNQAQQHCHVYVDTNGNPISDKKGNKLRAPHLRKDTDMIKLLPVNIKEGLIQVLSGLDDLARETYPGAFPDVRRKKLVYDLFVKDFLGDDVSINWEYVGFIVRKITDGNRLKMHVDAKNDSRRGYDICCTYSYVINGYRVTIVVACKQDFGRLFERIDEVGAQGGRFVPPNQVTKKRSRNRLDYCRPS